jgi:hypothetical protein
MAKIKPVSGAKTPAGPKNPGAIGCLVLIGLVLLVICLVLFFSLSPK